MKRNLIYYMWPVKNSIWHWNIALMKQFLPHFNGKKIFIIARDKQTEAIEEVIREIDCPEATILEVENDPDLRETKHFVSALGQVESVNPNEATFYAHAKGVSRDLRREEGLLGWVRALWFLNLGCIDLTDSLLSRYASISAFRWEYTHPNPLAQSGRFSTWHYSGTFFWLKHSTLFSRNWREIIDDPYGVEFYPGIQLKYEETFDLSEGRWRDFNLYHYAPAVDVCEEWLASLIAKDTIFRNSAS